MRKTRISETHPIRTGLEPTASPLPFGTGELLTTLLSASVEFYRREASIKVCTGHGVVLVDVPERTAVGRV